MVSRYFGSRECPAQNHVFHLPDVRVAHYSIRSNAVLRKISRFFKNSFITNPGVARAGSGVEMYLLRDAFDRERISDVKADEQEQEKREQKLLCRACGNAVTVHENRIEVGGKHHHTFFNPAGLVFELGCFKAAPGCQAVDEASAEFSWFAGYVWRVGLCRKCLSHLGWQFQSGDDLFYGLIISRLQDGLS